jgi:hypothetical protein
MKNTIISKRTHKKGTSIRQNAVTLRLPLDYPWKLLSALRKDLGACLTEDEDELLITIIRERDFSAYLCLSDIWGLQCTDPSDTLPKIRAKYMLASLLRKFQFQTDKGKRQATATKKFIDAELACAAYNRKGYKSLVCGATDYDVNVFTYARNWIRNVLGDEFPSPEALTLWSRHGPGASSNTRKGRTSKYFKYAEWPYDCTFQALDEAKSLIQRDERWIGALEDDYRVRNNVPKHLILNQKVFWEKVLNVVEGNRITFVPKDAQTERTIAIEPTMNLMLQLGVDGYIRRRLKRWDIDLDDQKKNQRLAKKGSELGGPESPVTLDLAAASDTISLAVCKHLLPTEWYDYLLKIRSPSGLLEGHTVRYKKISSMGNGYTFALESLIFASLTYGVLRGMGKHHDFRTNCAIYGDDIIVPRYALENLVRTLNNAGFRINTEKSFITGPIRESCGADWFNGKPVRPVFLKKVPEDIGDLFTDYNRLKRLLELRFWVRDSKTCALLLTWIPSKFKNLYGPKSNEEFSTYIHKTSCVKIWKNYVYLVPHLVKSSIKQASVGLNSPLRKLMNELRSSPPIRNIWERKNAGGSAFDVYKPFGYRYRLQYSASSNWENEYAE